MRNKDIQMTVINKYGVDKLLHIAYGGWITALFDNLIAMVFIAIVIGVGKELVDKYVRKSEFDYKDMVVTWLGGAITIIIKLIINML